MRWVDGFLTARGTDGWAHIAVHPTDLPFPSAFSGPPTFRSIDQILAGRHAGAMPATTCRHRLLAARHLN
jgi:hypothetical protein